MAHRGRLNVLTNIAGKTYGQVFREFEGSVAVGSKSGSGDVKYHLGTEGTFVDDRGEELPVYLAANPSHLETVDGVLEGSCAPSRTASPSAPSPGCPSSCTAGAVRRAGRGGRDAADVAAARLPHRRHDPRGRQQPGRLHHRPPGRALVGLRDRCRQDDPGSDLPRERRRPRSGVACRSSRSPTASAGTAMS